MRQLFVFELMMITSLALLTPAARAQSAKLDTVKIEELTGAKGTMNGKEGVFKVSMPRADLSVSAAGVKITPAMGPHLLGGIHDHGRSRHGHGRSGAA